MKNKKTSKILIACARVEKKQTKKIVSNSAHEIHSNAKPFTIARSSPKSIEDIPTDIGTNRIINGVLDRM